tara:strand:- start:1266 stop:2327 length:1062 start_codon:yes stop_codon:yes gene_type:complete
MGQHVEKKIKLLFCINSLSTGGAEKQLVYICNYLVKFYEIHIFLLENSKIKYTLNDNIKIHKKKLFFDFWKLLKKIKPNLIFLILPKTYFILGTILMFFRKSKVILMRRSLNYYHKNIFIKLYERFLHNFTDFFICNSNSAKKNLIHDEGVRRNKIKVIFNYIKKNNQINLNKKKQKEFKILYIANFYRYKGHHLLLKTLSLIKDLNWKLFLIGENRDTTKKELKNFCRKLKIKEKVYFLRKKNKFLNYPNINLGVSFSNTESFPNSILEYLSYGLPVMAYSVGDIKFLVDNKNGFIFSSKNENEISKILKKIILKSNLNNQSKVSFKKHIRFTNKNFTLNKYKKVIDKICAV